MKSNTTLETTLHCSAEFHLARLTSNLAPVIYSLAIRLSKGTGIFYVSLETLSPYLNASYSTVFRAVKELVEAGFFEDPSREVFKPTSYKVVKHEEWAANHPGACGTKISFPWSEESGDPLGVAMHTATGGRRKFFPGELKALRGLGLTDSDIVDQWKRFLEVDKPSGRRWKGSYFRFLKLLRQSLGEGSGSLQVSDAAPHIASVVAHG
jgi:hypothetical protein